MSLTVGSPAVAQSEASAIAEHVSSGPEDEAQGSGIADIFVTARRRGESLQDVPIAASAFDAVALEKSNVTSALAVARITPGVTMTEFNIAEPQIYIRGVGSQSDSVASEPSVLVSQDEVPIGRGGISPVAFLDTARVEVLRGPQGTLYGRNASAGGVNYYSNTPSDRFEGRVSGSIGSFDTFGGKAIVNVPLTEGVAMRGAAEYSHSDGYARNIRLGTRLQGGERYGGRLQFQVKSGDWTVLFSGDYAKADLTGDSRFVICAPNAVQALCAAATRVQADREDPWESAGSPDTFQYRRNYGLSARVAYDAGDVTVTSLSAYRNNDAKAKLDYFGLPPGFPFTTDNSFHDRSHQFSQELRVNSAVASPVQWVGGLFFYSDHIKRAERFVIDAATPPFPASLGGDTTGAQNGRTRSYAAYSQASVPFASIWELTVGARLTHDRKRVFQSAFRNTPGPGLGFPMFPGQPYAVPAGKNFTKPTWRVSLAVEPSSGKRFYASYDRGYKSGTFTSQAQNATQAQFAVDPEKLDSFNIGMKTQWLNNRLRLNADAYYLDYKKLQVFEFGANFASVLANADAVVKGVEVQLLATPIRNVTVGNNFSYMDGQIKSDPTFAGVVLPYDGNRLPRAPRTKNSTFVEVVGQLLGGTAEGRVNYDYQSGFFYNPSNDLASFQRRYGVWGAHVSWENDDGLKLSLGAENLSNTRYSVHNISFQGLALRTFAPPRSLTFSIGKTF